jgi:hypothetical protein
MLHSSPAFVAVLSLHSIKYFELFSSFPNGMLETILHRVGIYNLAGNFIIFGAVKNSHFEHMKNTSEIDAHF